MPNYTKFDWIGVALVALCCMAAGSYAFDAIHARKLAGVVINGWCVFMMVVSGFALAAELDLISSLGRWASALVDWTRRKARAAAVYFESLLGIDWSFGLSTDDALTLLLAVLASEDE